jgi:P27 family predicted phage terminase small subunit
MGRRGPIPRAESEDSVSGRNGYFRKTAALPSVAISDVVAPESVQSCPAAMAFWDKHAARLVTNKLLRPEQVDAFAILCHYHAEIEVLMARVAVEGLVVEAKQGPLLSPAARLLQQHRKDFAKLANDFGMTPAGEARIPRELAAKPGVNPLHQFGITG